MDVNGPLPALRALEITPFEGDDGETHFALHDRTQIAPQTIGVSPVGYFVLAHLDGQRTCADIQAAFEQQVGMKLPADQILALITALDDGLLLEGERFETAYTQRLSEYIAAEARDNRERYPDAEALRTEIETMVAGGVAAPVGEVRGLIAPHLDYARGAPCYADAYATLAKAPRAERYVILGVNHAGRSPSFVATTKDFRTPLGLAQTDRAFISRLEEGLGGSVCEFELDHLWEHSVELQVHVLQTILGAHPFQIVPLLCPNPGERRGDGSGDSGLDSFHSFAEVLAQLVSDADSPTVVIGGADLSHVGEQFGDQGTITPEYLEQVGRLDRKLLKLLELRNEDAFVAELCASNNPTRICGFGCIYTLLRTLPARACRVLSYHQAVDFDAKAHVTCAAAVIS